MDARIDRNMEDAVKGINELNELSDAERQQCWSGLRDLQMKTVDACVKLQITADSFREAADKLDQVWRDCKIAHAAGTTGGIISGFLTLAGVTAVTGGAATPLLLTGMGFGVGGVLTNIGTSFVEASIKSTEINKADKLWKETLEMINAVTTTVQSLLNKKEQAKIVYILCLAEANFEYLNPMLLKLLQEVVSRTFDINTGWKTVYESVSEIVREYLKRRGGKEIAQVPGKVQAGKTGLQMADDMAQVGKAGLQASDDVAQAGAKAGSKSAGKYAGKVLIAANIAFLMVDCIDLGFTVRDLVKNKGSEAAKDLRRNAKQLEDLLKE